MKLSRISSFITALLLTASFCSCNSAKTRQTHVRDKDMEFRIGQSYAGKDKIDFSELDELAADIAAEKLLEDMENDSPESVISADIQELLNAYNTIYELNTLLNIQCCKNENDTDAQIKSKAALLELKAAEDIISYAFCRGYNSKYKALFSDLVNKSILDKFTDDSLSITDVSMNAQNKFSTTLEYSNEYLEIINDTELTGHEKDVKCAALLLNMYKDLGTNALFTNYNRDYTGEDVLRISNAIKEYLIPAYDELALTYLTTYEHQNGITSEIKTPFETIQKYAPEISEKLEKNADAIVNNRLYEISYSTNSIDGYLCDLLPKRKSARIFIGDPDKVNDILSSALYTFGGFNYALLNDPHPYLTDKNVDIKELCSLGVLPFFLQFYDDIYNEHGKYNRLNIEYKMLDSLISGFFIGEFEYTVARDAAKLTPEEVVDRFNGLFEDYDYTYRLSDMDYIFISPGYYVSYGTSALAAFDLYNDIYNLNDQEKAVRKYENFSSISATADNYTLCAALKEAGFSNIMTEQYIKELADIIMKIDKEYTQ